MTFSESAPLAFLTALPQARAEVTVQVARGRKASRSRRAESPSEAGFAGRETAAVRSAR